MILGVPDVRQEQDFDCGAAAIDAVARFFSVRERGPVALANRVQGMAPDTVCAVLRSLGFDLLYGRMTVRDLRHLCNSGRPVLCPVAKNGGHWVVVRGVEGMRVFLHDPEDGPIDVSARLFASMWADTTELGHEFRSWGCAVSR